MKKIVVLFLCLQFFLEACVTNKPMPETTPTVGAVSVEVTETIQAPVLEETCLEFGEWPEGKQSPGKLIVYKNHLDGILDIADKSFIEFNGMISPDGEKIANYEFGKEVRVTDLLNNVLITFPWNSRWTEANKSYLGNSASSESLYYMWRDNNKITIPALPVGSLFILDIDTGETSELTFPYSDELWGWGGFADIRDNYVSYSPDLDKVVYASTMSHLVLRNNMLYQDSKWRTVVWAGFSFVYANPMWSPDSTKFAYVVQDDNNIDNLYLVYADMGGESALTNLKPYFHSPQKIWSTQISWSPNGKKIAFVAYVTQYEDGDMFPHLLVFDMDSKVIEDYCNPDPNNPHSSTGFSFAWSPNGEYIATDTTLVDLDSRHAYKIPDTHILGWAGADN